MALDKNLIGTNLSLAISVMELAINNLLLRRGRMGIYDGVVAYHCPDCHQDSPRGKDPWAKEMFSKYLALKEKKK